MDRFILRYSNFFPLWTNKINFHIDMYLPTPIRAGCDTRSVFKRSLRCLNSEFYFKTSCHTKFMEPSLCYNLPLAGGKTVGCIPIFANASHQTRLDTRLKARRPIKVGIKGEGRSGTSRDSNPAGLCCSSAHLVQCEPDEASSFTNPNVGPGTYASLRFKLDVRSSAIRRLQRRQNCSSPTRK